jgi:hypothetical protein
MNMGQAIKRYPRRHKEFSAKCWATYIPSTISCKDFIEKIDWKLYRGKAIFIVQGGGLQ